MDAVRQWPIRAQRKTQITSVTKLWSDVMGGAAVAKPLLTDEPWERIEPHIPPEPSKPEGGRPRVSDRACLTGILFVEAPFGSGCDL